MSMSLDLLIIVKTFPAILAQVIETRLASGAQKRTSAGNSPNGSVAEGCSV
jgi:hypothetical protein